MNSTGLTITSQAQNSNHLFQVANDIGLLVIAIRGILVVDFVAMAVMSLVRNRLEASAAKASCF